MNLIVWVVDLDSGCDYDVFLRCTDLSFRGLYWCGGLSVLLYGNVGAELLQLFVCL